MANTVEIEIENQPEISAKNAFIIVLFHSMQNAVPLESLNKELIPKVNAALRNRLAAMDATVPVVKAKNEMARQNANVNLEIANVAEGARENSASNEQFNF